MRDHDATARIGLLQLVVVMVLEDAVDGLQINQGQSS